MEGLMAGYSLGQRVGFGSSGYKAAFQDRLGLFSAVQAAKESM